MNGLRVSGGGLNRLVVIGIIKWKKQTGGFEGDWREVWVAENFWCFLLRVEII